MIPNPAKLVLAAIFLLLPFSASAQNGQDIVKTELMTLSFNGVVPAYYYKIGKKAGELSAFSQGISPPIYYAGPPVLHLYKNKEDLAPVKEGETPPKPLFSVKIPSGSERVLLLFAFTPKNKDLPSLKAYGIDDSTLGEGDYRIYNFAKKKVFVVLNDKKSAVSVSPGKQGTIRPGAWGREIGSVDAKLGIQDGKSIKQVYSSVWGHRPERRSFVFVFGSSDRNRPLNIRSFYDVPSYKPPREGAGAAEASVREP